VNTGQNDWDVHIPSYLFTYRNAVHLGSGYTPFYLMYLSNSNMSVDLIFQQPLSTVRFISLFAPSKNTKITQKSIEKPMEY